MGNIRGLGSDWLFVFLILAIEIFLMMVRAHSAGQCPLLPVFSLPWECSSAVDCSWPSETNTLGDPQCSCFIFLHFPCSFMDLQDMCTMSVGCCVRLGIFHGDSVTNTCVFSVIVQLQINFFLRVLLEGCSVSQNGHMHLFLELN